MNLRLRWDPPDERFGGRCRLLLVDERGQQLQLEAWIDKSDRPEKGAFLATSYPGQPAGVGEPSVEAYEYFNNLDEAKRWAETLCRMHYAEHPEELRK